MIILGLNTHHADSSAAIFKDGELLAATEEERFTRVKHWAGFPAQAIQFCLDEANTTLEDVDFITIGRDTKAKLGRKVLFALKNLKTGTSLLKNRIENRKDITSLADQFAQAFGCSPDMINQKLINVEHHRGPPCLHFLCQPL
ncbi:MAG: carbamoyltransferase N-terminal domain-containing protein [Bacteroidota bacterium]